MLTPEQLRQMGITPPQLPGTGLMPQPSAPALAQPPTDPAPQSIAQRMAQSPGWAMAMQGARNLSDMRQGNQVGVSPAQAYQQHVAAKQKRAMDEFQSRPTSYQEYQLAKQDGYTGTYADFLQRQASGNRPSAVREWEYMQSLPPDQQEQFMRMKRRGEVVKVGGIPGHVDPITGEWTPVTGQTADEVAADIARRAGEEAGQVTGAEEGTKFQWDRINTAVDRIDANRDAYAIAEQVKTLSEQWREQIRSGNVDTGPIDAFLLNVFGFGKEEMAELGADAIEQALNNLQIVNLAPVTEKEFGEIMKLWADIATQETPNIGRLNSAIRRTENLMARIEREARLRTDEIREYSPAEADRLLRYDPWLRGIVTGEEGDENLGDIPD